MLLASPKATDANGGYVALDYAASLVPSRPHRSTVHRWSMHGLLCRNGETVKLQVVHYGQRVMTRPEWLEQFFTAVAAAGGAQTGKKPKSKSKQAGRKRLVASHAQADDELRKAGM